MQFSMQSTAALAIFFLALPIFSSPSPAPSSTVDLAAVKTPTAGTPQLPASNLHAGSNKKSNPKENAHKLISVLRTYHDAVDAELEKCAKENGIEKCLSRIIGRIQGKLTGKALQAAKLKYHQMLGAELAECTKKTANIKGCMESSTAKGDKFQQKRDLALESRSGVQDFFTGFVQGFTGVMQAAQPVLELAAQFL